MAATAAIYSGLVDTGGLPTILPFLAGALCNNNGTSAISLGGYAVGTLHQKPAKK